MPTPVKWKDAFQVNIGDAAIGGQSEPRIIGLKFPTSSFLVVWLESSSGTVGSGAGVNIICQRFSRDGGPVGGPEQVNSVSANLDEEDFDIAATNDGGFVVVYAVHDGNRSTIIWERHNSGNLVMETRTVVTENVAGEGFSNPQVTVNALTDSSLVTFHKSVGGATDIRAVRINADGVIGPEFDAADNSSDISGIGGDVAILANGNFVQVYRATDGGTSGVDARIFTSAGTEIATIDLTNLNTSAFVPPEVASLANGNWVAAWKNTTGELRAQVYSPTGVAVTGQLQISGGLSDFPAPQVTALQGGAFVVVWAASASAPALARCFNADGSFDGDVFEVAAQWTDLDVAAAPDGRILFTWRENGEIVASIWDPRASVISASDYVMNARNFVDSTIVMGRPTDTTILGNGIDGMWLEGLDGNDVLSGGANSQELRGGGGDDILDGGSGADDMTGGSGNDTFFVNLYSANPGEGDQVGEFSGGGNDIVYASVSYALPFANTSIEILAAISQSATTAIDLTGNEVAQTIRGNNGVNVLRGEGGDDTLNGYGGSDQLAGGEGADTLDGGAAADTMTGGAGNDLYYADTAADQIVEVAGEGTDRVFASVSYTLAGGVSVETLTTTNNTGTGAIDLTGNELANVIYGNNGANVLNGGGGADTLIGWLGDDSYDVDNAGDRVLESAGQGNDRVFASVSYTLAAGVSAELLATGSDTGTTAINLTGNELANTVRGNDGANTLNGGGGVDTLIGRLGNDFYYVDNAADQIVETAGQGTDRVFASVSYTLAAGVSVETLTTASNTGTGAINLTGNALANVIYGNNGANVLDGAGGADTLIGWLGDDWFHVDNAGDRVVEAAGEGADRVFASVSYTLGAGVSVETFTTSNNSGIGAINLTGNELANTIYGNDGSNILDGKGGADTLIGRAGTDSFAFTSALGATNIDRLVDFSSVDDTIRLDNAIFTQIGAPGALNANAFRTGAAAQDADDRIVYNQATGQLFYDADGNGAGAAVLFASLDGNPALAASDFLVI